MRSLIKLLTDIGPLLIFFIIYKQSNLVEATIGLIIATIVSVFVMFVYERKIAMVPLISTILLTIMGGITVYTGDSKFIKLKLTIVNLLFASVLYIGVFFKKGLLRYLFGDSLQLSDKVWVKFSARWAIFFSMLAVANEIVWRNFSEDLWVKFKVFGVMALIIIFMISQMPFLYKSKLPEENSKQKP